MRKVLLISLLLIAVLVLATGLAGCGSSTVTPTTKSQFVSLRATGTTAAQLTRQQATAATRQARKGQMTRQQAAINSGTVDIYLWSSPAVGNDKLLTAGDMTAAYVSAYLSADGVHGVFSAYVGSYLQIFTGTIPTSEQTTVEPVQLTTDNEDHYSPTMSADASKVGFVKYDSTVHRYVVCTMAATAGAETSATCFDFYKAAPAVEVPPFAHPSFTPTGSIVFTAWLNSSYDYEIFMFTPPTGSETTLTLTQISDNSETDNWDGDPSVSADGKNVVVETWNDATYYRDIKIYSLSQTKQQGTTIFDGKTNDAYAYDPLFVGNTQVVFHTEMANDKSDELYVVNTTDNKVTKLTSNNNYDFFDLYEADWWDWWD